VTESPTAAPSTGGVMLAPAAAAVATGITVAARNAPAAGAKLADLMSLAVEVDLDVQLSTECFNVATEAADLGTRDTAALQCTHPLLGDVEQVREVGLGETLAMAQVSKDVGLGLRARVAVVQRPNRMVGRQIRHQVLQRVHHSSGFPVRASHPREFRRELPKVLAIWVFNALGTSYAFVGEGPMVHNASAPDVNEPEVTGVEGLCR
jgi:hypothetical protein